MSWYDSGKSDWYKPRGSVGAMPQEDNLPKSSNRGRIAALIACLCVIVIGIILIAGGYGVSNDSDGMPASWRDYMESIYGSGTVSTADIRLPCAEERGYLSLKTGASGASMAFSDIFDKCAPSVVGIKVFEDDDTEYYGWGSGVIASADGYIITNAHVIDGGDAATVVLYDGSEHEAMLIGYDAASDIALIKIDAEGLTAAEFSSSAALRVGDSVAAIGNPLSPDLRLTMTRGIVSALNREVSYNGSTMTLIQTDASINEGNSGGPLFNDRGQVVGITNMKMISTYGAGVEGLGFAIPSDTVGSIVQALVADGAVYGRATIGVTIGPITEDVAEHYNIPRGLYVSSVSEGSDAERKGIESGDIITKVNGSDAFENSDISDVKDTLGVGDTITFTIWRDGRTMDITVVLTDPADNN